MAPEKRKQIEMASRVPASMDQTGVGAGEVSARQGPERQGLVYPARQGRVVLGHAGRGTESWGEKSPVGCRGGRHAPC